MSCLIYFCADNHVSLFFSVIVYRFSTTNEKKINARTKANFHSIARVFEHGDPHETSYFMIRKLLFHVLRFCVFLKKNRGKTCSEIETTFFPQKSPKRRPREPVLGPKTVPN